MKRRSYELLLKRLQEPRRFIQSLIGPNYVNFNIPLASPRTFSYGKFQVSKLLIDKLDLIKRPMGLVTSNFEYRYIEHEMLGNLIYNDTNGNGYMDIGVKNETFGLNTVAVPTIGDEALGENNDFSVTTTSGVSSVKYVSDNLSGGTHTGNFSFKVVEYIRQ